MSFGENLISLRKQMGWSQDDLANNLNLSRQAISKWENDTSKPDIDNVKKISKIFSVTIDDLLNNEVPKEKAVALDVKKEEKKERTITIVKLMIITVIVLYVISVIYKFASLLIIVNGVQKYANLSNYHYVITTYENSSTITREEASFENGILNISVNTFKGDKSSTVTTYIDYNNNKGVIKDVDNNFEEEIDINSYLEANESYISGMQLYYKYPIEMRNKNYLKLLIQALDPEALDVLIEESIINIKLGNSYIYLNKEDLLPIFCYFVDENNNRNILQNYEIDL